MTEASRPEVVLVSPADEALGTAPRERAHSGDGMRHRALSLHLFDREGRVLLQRRSAGKRLWPLHWSNACCTHPLPGEDPLDACRRRAREELGIRVEPVFAFVYEYEARYLDVGVEHEVCHVFLARWDGPPQDLAPDPTEVEATTWRAPDDLRRALADAAAPYTPWLRIAWPRVEASAPRLLA
jgi:isopentenyl-diphosphate delta-isomerase